MSSTIRQGDMVDDPLPDVVPFAEGVRCDVCGVVTAGVAWLVDHYRWRHPIRNETNVTETSDTMVEPRTAQTVGAPDPNLAGGPNDQQ